MGSQQQFCLRWNNHQVNMLGVFDHLLQSESLVDVTLACEGLSMKAHKVVLSACSPFFQHIFVENPCKHPVIVLKDVKYPDLRALVDFMYRGEVNVSQDQLSALLKTAEALKVKGLAEVTGGAMGAEGLAAGDSAMTTTTLPAALLAATQAEDSPTSQPPSQLRMTDTGQSPPAKRKRTRQRRRSGSSNGGYSDPEESPEMQTPLEVVETKVEILEEDYQRSGSQAEREVSEMAVMPSPQTSVVPTADMQINQSPQHSTEAPMPINAMTIFSPGNAMDSSVSTSSANLSLSHQSSHMSPLLTKSTSVPHLPSSQPSGVIASTSGAPSTGQGGRQTRLPATTQAAKGPSPAMKLVAKAGSPIVQQINKPKPPPSQQVRKSLPITTTTQQAAGVRICILKPAAKQSTPQATAKLQPTAKPQQSTPQQATKQHPSTSQQAPTTRPSTSQQAPTPRPSTSQQVAKPQPSTSQQAAKPQPSTSQLAAKPQQAVSQSISWDQSRSQAAALHMARTRAAAFHMSRNSSTAVLLGVARMRAARLRPRMGMGPDRPGPMGGALAGTGGMALGPRAMGIQPPTPSGMTMPPRSSSMQVSPRAPGMNVPPRATAMPQSTGFPSNQRPLTAASRVPSLEALISGGARIWQTQTSTSSFGQNDRSVRMPGGPGPMQVPRGPVPPRAPWLAGPQRAPFMPNMNRGPAPQRPPVWNSQVNPQNNWGGNVPQNNWGGMN